MEDKLYNVAIYIDYENIHKSLLCQHMNLLRLGFFEKIHRWSKDKGLRIIKIAAYCNFDNKDLHDSYHQTRLQEYGVVTIHTSNRGKNYADLQITIDALNDMYNNNNIDEFIIMSNDKDMSPLLNTIKTNKRKATLLTVGSNYDYALCNVPDEHITLDDIVGITLEGSLYITRLEAAIMNNILSFAQGNIDAKIKGVPFKHIEIDHYVKNQVSFFSIMEYEMYNILKTLYDENKIFIYKYNYRNADFNALLPLDLKQLAIQNQCINEIDIITTYDFELIINKTYDKYCKK